jgi:hypothetical protein
MIFSLGATHRRSTYPAQVVYGALCAAAQIAIRLQIPLATCCPQIIDHASGGAHRYS